MAPDRNLPEEEAPRTRHMLSSASLPAAISMAAAVEDSLDLAELRLDLCEDVGRSPNPDDDELTSLTWLQDRNLLKSIRAGAVGEDALSDSSPLSSDYLDESSDCGGNGIADGVLFLHQSPNVPYNPKIHVNAKPPYSFSCLIFMAIEDAIAKALPVKDIYSWILNHFPYFQNAPTGWKNSVRHNLSLNKCFRKVDKEKGQNIGKGSLWCIDPDYRPNLLQALRKTPYHPYHQLQMLASQTAPNSPQSQKPLPLAPRANLNIPNPELFPYLSKRLAASNIKDPEVDAAATMLALKNGPHLLSCDKDEFTKNGHSAIHVTSERRRKRLKNRLRTSPANYHRIRRYVPIISCSPSEDHTYSTNSQNGGGDSPTNSSIDEAFEFSDASNSEDGNRPVIRSTCVENSESNASSFDDDFESCGEDEEEEEENWEVLARRRHRVCHPNDPEDDDEEQKKIVEGADALLNLAGIKTHLTPLRKMASLSSTNCGPKKESLSDLAQR